MCRVETMWLSIRIIARSRVCVWVSMGVMTPPRHAIRTPGSHREQLGICVRGLESRAVHSISSLSVRLCLPNLLPNLAARFQTWRGLGVLYAERRSRETASLGGVNFLRAVLVQGISLPRSAPYLDAMLDHISQDIVRQGERSMDVLNQGLPSLSRPSKGSNAQDPGCSGSRTVQKS